MFSIKLQRTSIADIMLDSEQENMIGNGIATLRNSPSDSSSNRQLHQVLGNVVEELFRRKKVKKPNMISLKELREKSIDCARNANFKIPLLMLDPEVDSFYLPMNALFSNGVQVVESLTNCNANLYDIEQSPPSTYYRDKSEGSKAQLAAPLAAYYRWNVLQNNPDACDFLVEFKKEENTIACDEAELGFEDIFFENNGFVYPRTDFEEAAERFLKEYADKIKINFEKVSTYIPGKEGKVEYFQALTAAFSLSALYSGKSEDEIKRCQAAAKLFLMTQFEIVALATVCEAQKNPGTPIPLVFSTVGYGNFNNDLSTVASAIENAIRIVGESGCKNLQVYLSCFKQNHLNQFLDYFLFDSPIKEKLEVSQVNELQSHRINSPNGLGQRSSVHPESVHPLRLSPPAVQMASSSCCCRLFNWMRRSSKHNIQPQNEQTHLMKR